MLLRTFDFISASWFKTLDLRGRQSPHIMASWLNIPFAGTGLYQLRKHGLYHHYNPDKLVDNVAHISAHITASWSIVFYAGTGLYELWKHGLYRNYHPDKLVDLVARILALLPPWVRVYRIQVSSFSALLR